jgi:hypothetical protein
MHLLTRAVSAIAIAAALLSASNAYSAPVDFTPFAGKYVGSWLISSPSGGGLTTSVTVRVKVPRNGRTMTVTMQGTILLSGVRTPVSTTMVFGQNRKLTSDAVLMGYFGPASTLPARYALSRSRFDFAQFSAPGATILGTPFTAAMNYTMRFSRTALSITGAGFLDTGSGASDSIFEIRTFRVVQ